MERCEYAYTSKTGEELSEQTCTHFSYDYDGDRLISYNGEECEYNNFGSPVKYRGKTLQWSYGKFLTNYDGVSFVYDGLGRRVQKNNIEYIYYSAGNLIKQNDGFEFIYDASGIVGVRHGGAQYFYRKDAQGNITAILDSDGNLVVKYVYDAWGNHAVLDADGNDIEDLQHIGNVNPLRYRGYCYDRETGLYYLGTRYYDPETGRFISQDGIEYADPQSINGLNLYAYCGNNPVMCYDPSGMKAKWYEIWKKDWWMQAGKVVGGIVLAAVGVAITSAAILPALVSPLATVTAEFGLTLGFYGAALVGSVFNSTINSDMELIGWNPYNKNAGAVMSSQILSFYKGVPVLRADMGSGRSGSFGIIMLDRNDKDADAVKHEFGHIPQLMMLGIFKYGLCIGLPSYKNWYNRTSWDYYEAPWDAGAEYFGGANNGSHPLTAADKRRAMEYLIYSYFLGPIVHSFYKKL